MEESFANQYKQMDVDEDRGNAVWLEDANNNFQQALAEENWPLAQDIIKDVKDAPFLKESQIMAIELEVAMKVESDRITEHND